MAANKKVVRKRRDVKRVDKGRCYIQSSFNNTLVTFTDEKGNTISWSSSGKLGLRGSKMVAEDAAKIAKDLTGLKSVEVYVKGPGAGRESAIRALQVVDIAVTMIKDVSPIPHNGCRPPKRRRL